jgi:hypothetical protein
LPSPSFHFAAQSALVKYSATAAGSVVATLDSLSGVRSVAWSVITTDDTDVAATRSATIITSGTLGSICTLTAGAAGTAGILRCVINGGINDQTEQPDATYTAKAKFYVLTADGYEVICADEQLESNSTFGWAVPVNAAIRYAGTAGGGSGTPEDTAATPDTLALRDAGGGCAFEDLVCADLSIPSGGATVAVGYFQSVNNVSAISAKNTGATYTSLLKLNASNVCEMAAPLSVTGAVGSSSTVTGTGFIGVTNCDVKAAAGSAIRLYENTDLLVTITDSAGSSSFDVGSRNLLTLVGAGNYHQTMAGSEYKDCPTTYRRSFDTTLRYTEVVAAASTLDVAAGGSYALTYNGTVRYKIDATGMGFFNATPVAKPTGVAVTAAAIHAALVSLGLIAA